ncbi:hypothetical protein SCUP234_07890 [Seiridium cupressi]
MDSPALLRVMLLLAATSYVTFTFSEDTFVRPLMHTGPPAHSAELRHHTNRSLPALMHFTRRGLPFIFISYLLAIATAAANLSRGDLPGVSFTENAGHNARTAATFYLAGLVFSVLHFGPTAMGYLNRVQRNEGIEGDIKGDNTANMMTWLKINAMRALVADIPSWACYLLAFTFSMS